MLEIHNKVVHKKVREHGCAECGFAFTSKSNLLIHIERVHKKIKDHICDECGYAASLKADLKGHIDRVHKKITKKHIFVPSSYPNLIVAFNVDGIEATLVFSAAAYSASFTSSSPFTKVQSSRLVASARDSAWVKTKGIIILIIGKIM